MSLSLRDKEVRPMLRNGNREIKTPGGLNLVVFPDRISVAAGNFLEVHDPHGNLTQRLGLQPLHAH